MEEINLKDLFDYFVSKWAIIVITCLAFVFVGVIYTAFLKTPMYNSYTTIVLTMNSDSSSNQSITQSDITLNKNLISTYRGIMRSHRILNQVINNLNLGVSADELKSNVSVTSDDDTELIKISVNSENSEDAMNIANEIAKVFSNDIQDIYSIKNVSIIDYAEEASNPYNINMVKQVILMFLIGLVLSSAVVFIMFYFDTTVKSTEEIEKKIGLPCLGVVPIKYMPKDKGGKRKWIMN